MQVVDTPDKDVQGVCAINHGESKFEMCGLSLEKVTCTEPIILPIVKSCKTQPCGVKTTQQFSELVILLT